MRISDWSSDVCSSDLVGERCRDIIFARPAAVDIVDAEAEKPARAARGNLRKHRAIGVAEVELAGRAGGETRQHSHRHESICCGESKAIIPYVAGILPP